MIRCPYCNALLKITAEKPKPMPRPPPKPTKQMIEVVNFVNGRIRTESYDLVHEFGIRPGTASARLCRAVQLGLIRRIEYGSYGPLEENTKAYQPQGGE